MKADAKRHVVTHTIRKRQVESVERVHICLCGGLLGWKRGPITRTSSQFCDSAYCLR